MTQQVKVQLLEPYLHLTEGCHKSESSKDTLSLMSDFATMITNKVKSRLEAAEATKEDLQDKLDDMVRKNKKLEEKYQMM